MIQSIDKKVNVQVLNELQVKLRRFSLNSKLEMSRKISHIIDPLMPKQQFEEVVFKDGSRSWFMKYKQMCPIFEIEYIALISTVCGEWRGSINELESTSDYTKLLNLYRAYIPPFAHKNDDKLANMVDEKPENWKEIRDLFLLRTALQQFKFQEHYIKLLYRYNYFYTYKDENIDMENIFVSEFFNSYNDFVKFSTALYLLSSITLSTLDENKIIQNIGHGLYFTPEKVKEILHVLIMDRNTAIEQYENMKSEDERMKIYNYNPYTMKPILSEEEYFYLPIPQLLFRSITEGFYHMLCFNRGLSFRNLFGKNVFESYVLHVLNWNIQDYKIIPEFKYIYNRNKVDSSDFILVKGNDLILIEVKANAPSIKLKSSDLKEYREQLYKAYGKGIIQCIKKEHHIRKGILKHKDLPEFINKIYYLIVTLEDFYMPVTDFMIDTINQMCNEENVTLPDNKDFHVMGIQTVESIMEEDDRSIFEYLEIRGKVPQLKRSYAWFDVNRKKPLSSTKVMTYWKEQVDELICDLFINN